MKPGKARILNLSRKLADASIEGGEPSPRRVDAVLAFLGGRPMSERRAVLAAYLKMMRREEARRTLLLERAGSLDGTSKKALVEGLAKSSGMKLIVTEKENPALIGGLRVRLGDDVYDASLRGMLNRLAVE